jgi:peptidoglycan/LPS O-acetylase OafA/YrhL
MTSVKSAFRYDINALRALAVIAVTFYHYDVAYFDGGFAGVDIFFVISGYLMSRIVIKGLDKNEFSIVDFYNKRGKRIVPALAFLIMCVTIGSFFFYLPSDFHEVVKNGTASFLFYSNILYSQTSYFDVSSDNNIFLHTWSLSLEWQFYLILPLILVLINKYLGRHYVLIIYVFTSFVLFLLSLFVTKHNPNYSFYLLPTRSWEMLVGGVAFLIEDKVTTKFKQHISIVGYLILLGCIFGLNDRLLWPGLFTLLPVFGTFLIIIADWNSYSVLKSGVVQFLGKVSYSLYLWHWPVLVIAIYLGYNKSPQSIVIMLLVSTAMSYISYRYVENIRISKVRNLLIATSCLVSILVLLTFTNSNNIVFDPQNILISEYKKNHLAQDSIQFNYACFINPKKTVFNKERCVFINEKKKNVILLGDSHAAQYFQSFKEQLYNKNVHLIQATSSGCLPTVNRNGLSGCSELINFMYYDFIPKNYKQIDGIVLSANWILSKSTTQIGEIKATLDYINKFRIPIVIIGQNETYTIPFASIAAREHQFGREIRLNYLDPESKNINDKLKVAFKDNYIEIYNSETIKKLSIKNTPYMSDQNHFTKYGADCITHLLLSNEKFSNLLNSTIL